LTVLIVLEWRGQSLNLARINIAHLVGDFLKTGDFQALSVFDGCNEI
jgi:hypothetical protein